MCTKIKVLSKVKSGELYLCCQCEIYHLEFNNIYLELNKKEFKQFKSYILDLEIEYWQIKYASARVKRKIPIPSMQHNLVLMFNSQEILELKHLFSTTSNHVFTKNLTTKDIDYTLILN
ncbi:hypothetical protein FPF71_13305 [Algibacter amylolyticus]|uniref:Uncharacterized protein n=1 Tax=Algibacter amylolyticus TaxID=1608400 RepID=A0A5M7B2M2_9FLAO|nr:DUF6686 family protein [Algibacter amylolyticus]KAA5823669.1 hypothetical protein F2B50_13305 [Algibacter amylolyticus]MBB5267832.1 hypothetical protein [Algibacter amylolyticus]TSJ74157.1 hypothetical protein FPF71_13305 [Algibacter amylolyticus]